MRIGPNAHLPRVLSPALILAAGVLWNSPAFAWERVYGYALEPGDKCSEKDTPKLLGTDRRAFRIPAGFDGEIEIYGHGVDLSGSAEVAGHSSWAQRARGVSGIENAVRGCGAIGSLVIKFEIPYDAPAGNFTLRFGTETMAITVIKPPIDRTIWSPQTMIGHLDTPEFGTGTPSPTPPPRLVGRQSSGCAQSGAGCSNGSSVLILPYSGGSANSEPNLPNGIGGCMAEVGGKAAISGTTMTIDLPRDRNNRALSCLVRPMFLKVETGIFHGDLGGYRAGLAYAYPDAGLALVPPVYSGNLSGLNGPTPLNPPSGDFQQLRLSLDLARTFVGERRITLTPRSGSGASVMTLVLRSDPANGVQSIAGLPFTGPRLSSDIGVKFDFYSLPNGQRFHWRLRGLAGSNPAACFTAASGSLTANSDIARFSLTATEATGCAGRRFALDIGPDRAGTAIFTAPYARSVDFELPARSAPVLKPRLPGGG